MAWWLPILIFTGLTVVGELLRPRPKYENARASSLGDIDFPTSTEGRPIPVVFGTAHLKGPNILWFGDYAAVALKEKVSSGSIFGGSKKVTVGYAYYLGLCYGLCMGPVDEVVELRFDDKPLPSGKLVVGAGNKALLVDADAAGSPATANIAEGTYANAEALAVALEAAIVSAAGGTWKVATPWFVAVGRTDQIVVGVKISGVVTKSTVTLAPGRYETGWRFAAEVARALNANEAAQPGGSRGSWSVQYRGGALAGTEGRFTMRFVGTAPGYQSWLLYAGATAEFAAASTALPLLGMRMERDSIETASWGTLTGDFGVYEARFVIAFKGTTARVMLSSSSSTAREILGFRTTGSPADATGLGSVSADFPVFMTGTTYQPGADSTRVDVVAPALFGGERVEGGIVGPFVVYHGTTTQLPDPYLEEKIGAALPAYRRLCYAVARHVYLGTNLYIKAPSFVVRRCPNSLGLAGGKENISGDCNPAAAIYDILTDTTWGLGIPAALIDSASFVTAGNTLYTEGNGVSFAFDSVAPAADWIDEILRHVDGLLFEDPLTGKIKLSLTRADYSVGALPLIDDSIAELDRFSRPSWDDLKNAVRVSYIDRSADFMERTVKAQELASIEARGGDEVLEEIPFSGFSNAAAAQRAAGRALTAVSFPVARITLKANRKVWSLRPGSVFRWTWPALGITDLPFRVARVRTGGVDDSTLEIDAVQDIFGSTWTAYTPPTAPDWQDSAVLPPALIAVAAFEVPYALLDAAENRIMTFGVPGATGTTWGYVVYTDPAGAQDFRETERVQTPTPSGRLAPGIGPTDLSMTVLNDFGVDALRTITPAELVEGRNLVQIDSEMIAFRYVEQLADGTWEISGLVRGVMDTVPALHANNARCYFVRGGVGLTKPDTYLVGTTVAIKLTPYNRRGELSLGEQTALSLVVAGRATKPYAPTDLKLNAISYPTNINGDLVISWEHRDRLADWSYADAGKTAAIEAGCTYTVKIYGETGTLLRTATGITGKTYTYLNATELSDSGGLGRLNGILTVEVYAVRTADSAESPYRAADTVDAAGWGMLWGEYYGGAAA